MRSKRLLLNSLAALLLEFLLVINGLILPQLIITNYGSATNGLLSSVAQFLAIIALLRSGVGGVVRASLYKPLAEKNNNEISAIVKASTKFMRKIALIFAVVTVLIAAFYPFLVQEEFDWLFTSSLVLILGIGTFAQYYFGMSNQLLLIADQKQYIYTIIHGGAVVANLIASVIIIKAGASIHFVKLATSLCYAATPIFLHLYVKKNYSINFNVEPNNEAISQRWDAMFHQLANFIRSSAPVLILTVFVPLHDVSVYSVYVLIFQGGISNLINVVFSNMDATFGDIIAKDEKKLLERRFETMEFIVFHAAWILFACAYILTPSFISIYTQEVIDVNYQRPIFLILFTLAEVIFALRTPYYSLINAAGMYKQTKKLVIIESAINVIISILAVLLWGLIGIAIGSLCAMTFKTLSIMIFASKNILHQKTPTFLKRIITVIPCFVLPIIIFKFFDLYNPLNYFSWVIYAVCITAIVGLINVIYMLIFERTKFFDFLNILKVLKNRKRQKIKHSEDKR